MDTIQESNTGGGSEQWISPTGYEDPQGVWTGTWVNLFASLNVGWNNATVSSYLTSSTFTIRFVGETETGDTTQDYWTIDANTNTQLDLTCFLETPFYCTLYPEVVKQFPSHSGCQQCHIGDDKIPKYSSKLV